MLLKYILSVSITGGNYPSKTIPSSWFWLTASWWHDTSSSWHISKHPNNSACIRKTSGGEVPTHPDGRTLSFIRYRLVGGEEGFLPRLRIPLRRQYFKPHCFTYLASTLWNPARPAVGHNVKFSAVRHPDYTPLWRHCIILSFSCTWSSLCNKYEVPCFTRSVPNIGGILKRGSLDVDQATFGCNSSWLWWKCQNVRISLLNH